jgi:glutamyl-tRNA reductase
MRSQGVVPTIRALREHFASVARLEAEKAIASLKPDATPEQQAQIINRTAELIANKLLHQPMTALKHGGDERQAQALVRATLRLFELKEVTESDDDARVPTGGNEQEPA